MLFSLAIIFLEGSVLGNVLERFKLPRLIGMLLTGVLMGPYVGNIIDPSILDISADLRQIALIIILTRAGLSLDIKDLKKVGRPALLMCFVPATFEIIGVMVLAPKLLGISLLQAAVLGTVVAAVSPAVVVPKMLGLMEAGYGTKKGIPQMVLAGASVDDVFVIVLFTAFTGLLAGGSVHATDFLTIPVSIVLGIIVGVVTGYVLTKVFTHFHMRDTTKVGIILSVAFLMVSMEKALAGIVGFSGLLGVMAMGVLIQQQKSEVAVRLSNKFSKLWVGAEVLLFVLVGATVNIDYAAKAGLVAVVLVLGALVFRMAGVFTSLLNTQLSPKEKVFTAIAYMPKATVQAAIGGLPLAMGLPGGEIILTVAVVAIMVTAPIGALLIDNSHKRLLTKSV
ncbi:cation:proton antiporter [Jeotgalibaca sp. A127]|uniref:cation:proton antiporter n=1 Tax=Jeotgalibaca sp. A127 TaxID=3457324 RepID=UPI003FD28B15